MFNLHGYMLKIEHNAMLVIINIGRILKAPAAFVDGHRNDPVILSGGMIHPACIPLVLPAQQALRITGLLCVSGRRDGLGILFRLGEVDGDIQVAILCIGNPFHVPADTVSANIVGVLAELVIVIRNPMCYFPFLFWLFL